VESLDDNTSRLVYADWLDDHDQPTRAEFIRVQISLATKTDVVHGRPWDADLEAELTERELVLLRANRAVHAAELHNAISNLSLYDIEFERGFPEALHLRDAHNQLPQLADVADITTIRKLNIADQKIRDDELKYVSALKQLTELDLNLSDVTDDGMVHLTGLSNLRVLDLSFTDVTSEGLRILAMSPHLSSDLEIDMGPTINLGAIRQGLGIEPQHLFSAAAGKAGSSWAEKTENRTPRTLT
jgi:uncharacterized protein (TIGR02996 family)